MEFQTLFNAAVGGIMMLSGWILRAVWDALKSLREDLHSLERNIPHTYVRRDEYREDLRDIKEMLRHISGKLDEKQDK
jgi:hypothetical protein